MQMRRICKQSDCREVLQSKSGVQLDILLPIVVESVSACYYPLYKKISENSRILWVNAESLFEPY